MKTKKEINSSNIKDTKDLNQKLKEYFDKIISEFNLNDEITKIESVFIKIEEMSSELLKKLKKKITNYSIKIKKIMNKYQKSVLKKF